MGDTFLISGLTKKHKEIEGQIEYCHKEIARLSNALGHLRATIELIAPEIDLETLEPKEHRVRISPYKNGEVPRMIMDVLRESEQPMATNEIAYKIAEMRGLPTDKDYDRVVKPIHSALQRMRMQNIIEPVGRLPGAGGGPILWQLIS
jgi:hypothetical protein